MSAHVDVDVVLEDGTEWRLPNRRPLRRLPDGGYGVVYHGQVYPYHSDGYIRLGDVPYETETCPVIFEWNADESYDEEEDGLEDIPWHLERNRFGRYVVFDGSEEMVDAVIQALQRRGLGYVKWDQSMREADDGYFYDWYVKLDPEAPDEGLMHKLEDLMHELVADSDEDIDTGGEAEFPFWLESRDEAQVAPAGRPKATPEATALLVGPLEDLLKEREVLRKQAHSMAQTNQNLSQSNLALAKENQGLHQQLSLAMKERSSAAALYEKLSADLESLRERLPVDQQLRQMLSEISLAAVEKSRTEEIELERERLRREFDAAERLMEEEQKRREDAEESLRESETVVANLNARVSELEQVSRDHRQQRPRRWRRLPKMLLRGAFRRLQLDDSSLGLMSDKFDNLKSLVDVLEDLNRNGDRYSKKKIASKDDWWEVNTKVATGRKESARVYYCPAPESDQDELLVWVRMKSTQREDICRME